MCSDGFDNPHTVMDTAQERFYEAEVHRVQGELVLDVCLVSPAPVERMWRRTHPVPRGSYPWISRSRIKYGTSFAGMTRGHKDWQCMYEMDI